MPRLTKVQVGDPLKIPASDYNSFIEVVKENRTRRPISQIDSLSPFSRRNDLVLVKNRTAEPLAQGAILGIDGPLILPTENEHEFQTRLAFVGVLPIAAVHGDRFVVLAEPLTAGTIGRAWVSGLCQVKVQVLNTADNVAGLADGQTTALRSGIGSIPILWKELGVGVKWAIIKFTGAGGGAAVEHVVVREVYASENNPQENVLVQAVDRDPVTGTIYAVGSYFNAQAKPGLRSSDYYAWVWPGTIDQRQTRILPCYQIRGTWRLGFEPDMVAEVLDSSVRISDCRPSSRAAGTPLGRI